MRTCQMHVLPCYYLRWYNMEEWIIAQNTKTPQRVTGLQRIGSVFSHICGLFGKNPTMFLRLEK